MVRIGITIVTSAIILIRMIRTMIILLIVLTMNLLILEKTPNIVIIAVGQPLAVAAWRLPKEDSALSYGLGGGPKSQPRISADFSCREEACGFKQSLV